MAVTVYNVARYYLYKSNPTTEWAITHLKLQKLVYYAQAWYSVIKGQPLFNEKIEAWKHGPVSPDLYYKYKDHGYNIIPRVTEEEPLSNGVKRVLDDVWTAYGSFSGSYLEQLTHSEDPWQNAIGPLNGPFYMNNEITVESMRTFYSRFKGGR
jgi:uncharacterized phage-associated protein